MRLPAAWTGLLIFAVLLAAAEMLAGRRAPWLAAKMLAAAAAGVMLFRLIPWPRLARLGLVSRRWRLAALYFLVLAHFLRILVEEIRSLYFAWKLAAPPAWRRVWWRSLAHATAGLFPRVLRRAERFYAALLVCGMAE
ncbi:MAG: hypothetical protein N2036_03065 [Bryobacteraceae bacterium]|nr:hypothetical protein [Bryobacteraceae bacterium]